LILNHFQDKKQLVKYFLNKIKQKDLALDHFKQKYTQIINNLENNKIFLNMAVHDMRNPTSQIEYVLKDSL
jgi:hypothetical protein